MLKYLLACLWSALVRIDSTARLRVALNAKINECKATKVKLAVSDSRCEDLRAMVRSREIDLEKRDAEILVLKLSVDHMTAINERNIARVDAELAAAQVQIVKSENEQAIALAKKR